MKSMWPLRRPSFLLSFFTSFLLFLRSWAKVIFLQACVCPRGEGCLPQCMLGYPPPLGADPPQSRHPPPPREQTHPPPGADTPWSRHPPRPGTPPPGSRLQHTVNERPVRILLECILFMTYFHRAGGGHGLLGPPPVWICY